MIFIVLCTGLLGSAHVDSVCHNEQKAEKQAKAESGWDGTCWVTAKTPQDKMTCPSCYSEIGGR